MAEAVGTVKPIRIEEEMRSSYLDYAMSVIVSRALPDVRDGLKPVMRRILYAMDGLGLRSNSPYRKSARIVGEVLGKFHPHGDAPVYEAMVRMAQPFSMRYPLVDGQGNFGSVDDDPPAAMRYTEARLAEIAQELLVDIDRDTVDFVANFDDSLREPTLLPSRLPNLLLNGSSGIAVGMATNIPPHNLKELCNAIIHLIDNPETTPEELLHFVPGPDFPTGGIIIGREGIKNAYVLGRGRIIVRARAQIEDQPRTGRYQIAVTELPYQVNKATLVERIAELARERKVEGISEVRDESDREGLRIAIELRRDSQPRQVLNALYRHTAMQSTFFVNMLALVNGEPRTLTLKSALQHFIHFRQEVVTRRSRYDLKRAQERAHILEGLKIALDHLDRVIRTIRQSPDQDAARQALISGFKLSEIQAQAILDMPLRRLAALERQKSLDEYVEVLKKIAELEGILSDPRKVLFIVKDELKKLIDQYKDSRRTHIIDQELTEFREEDLIQHQEVLITISSRGYIKRQPTDTYRAQKRGGRGITGMATRETDAVKHLIAADTHDSLLFFTDRGRVFQLRCYYVPDASRQARGLPLINLIGIDQNEQVTAVVATNGEASSHHLMMVTKLGEIKKTSVEDFSTVRSGGLIAMDLEPEDELISARLMRDNEELILVTRQGRATRFPVAEIPTRSRTSGGVRAIRLEDGDAVIAFEIVGPNADLLLLTSKGFGKRAPLSAYPIYRRGGKGVITAHLTPKTGPLVGACVVRTGQELMIISAQGIVLRTKVDDANIRIKRRTAQFVSIMNLDPGDALVSVACLDVLNRLEDSKSVGSSLTASRRDRSPTSTRRQSKGSRLRVVER